MVCYSESSKYFMHSMHMHFLKAMFTTSALRIIVKIIQSANIFFHVDTIESRTLIVLSNGYCLAIPHQNYVCRAVTSQYGVHAFPQLDLNPIFKLKQWDKKLWKGLQEVPCFSRFFSTLEGLAIRKPEAHPGMRSCPMLVAQAEVEDWNTVE